MALESTLKDYPITEMFQFIGRERKTGVVRVSDEERAITVSFLNGRIVNAESTIREKKEHLGEMLVRANIISKLDLGKALGYQKETLQRLGDILIKYDMISVADLREMIQLQITETIYGLLTWKKGFSKFNEQSVDYDKENVGPIPAELILMDGMRRMDEWPKLRRVIKSFDIVYQKAFGSEEKVLFGEEEEKAGESVDEGLDDAFGAFDAVKKPKKKKKSGKKTLDKHERRVFSFIDSKKTVQKIINLSRLGEFDTCKVLVALLEDGLIEVAVADKDSKEERTKYDILETTVNIIFIFIFILAFLVISTTVNITDITSIKTSFFFEVKKEDILKETRSIRQIDKLKNAVQLYYLKNKKYPQNLESLIHEELVNESDILDPLGNTYLYKAGENSFNIEKIENRISISK